MSITEQDFVHFLSEAVRYGGEGEITDPDGRINYWLRYPVAKPFQPSRRVQALLQNTGAEVEYVGNKAVCHALMNYYNEAVAAKIFLPDLRCFDKAGQYYATLFHELGHWAGYALQPQWMAEGHALSAHKGDEEYPPEEVLACAVSYFMNESLGTLDAAAKDNILRFVHARIVDRNPLGMIPNAWVQKLYELTRQRLDFLLSFDAETLFQHPNPQPEPRLHGPVPSGINFNPAMLGDRPDQPFVVVVTLIV